MGALRWLVVLVPLGCAPTYAPPIRSPMMGAPGRVQHGDVELGGGAAGVIAPGYPPVYGGPVLAIGVSRRVALEAGGDFTARGWAMGFAGARITGRIPITPRLRLVGDTELGLGLGVGGTYCTQGERERCDEDGRAWHERLAGGGYGGLGGALRWRIPALFTRIRVQPTVARNVPVTVWTVWQTGVELRFAERVSLWASAGIADYHNRMDSAWGGVYELGLAVRLR